MKNTQKKVYEKSVRILEAFLRFYGLWLLLKAVFLLHMGICDDFVRIKNNNLGDLLNIYKCQ